MIVTFGGEVKTYRDMKTEIKNFPRGLDVKDLLYLIWKALLGMQGGSSDGGSEGGCSCLAPMFVTGYVDDGGFIPDEDAPSWDEAHDHVLAGGVVYFQLTDDGAPVGVEMVTYADDYSVRSANGEWANPNGE